MSSRHKPKKKQAPKDGNTADFQKLAASTQKVLGGRPLKILPTEVLYPGREKLSVAIENIAKPIVESLDTWENKEKCLAMAIAVWNITILPEKEAKQMILELLKATTSDSGSIHSTAGLAVISEMMIRKQRLYPDDRRYVVNYTIEDRPKELYFQVASIEI